MSFDDDQKRKALKGKEQKATYEGKTDIQKLQREITEASQKKDRMVLERNLLKDAVQKEQQKSAPTKEKQKSVTDAKTQAGSAKEHAEKQRVQQEEIDQALAQNPEQSGETPF